MMNNVVLVGGGHAHVYILKQLQLGKWSETQDTLISPDRYQYYSGMFSGYVEGFYGLKEIRIDLVKLCESANINFIKDTVDRVHPEQQEIVTSNGTRMKYEAISFNIGSNIANTNIPGVQDYAVLIKPNQLISGLKDSSLSNERLVVVGGGASGFEISLALQASRSRLGLTHPVTLISAGHLMKYTGKQGSRKAEKIVRSKGVNLIQNDAVISAHEDWLELESGLTIAHDELVWLTGPAAPPLFRTSDLPTDIKGFLSVNDNLQCVAYENMFGAGDCISLTSYPSLHKAGVYAVREAPVLWSNLDRYLSGRRLKKYRPQSHYLSILSTGEGEALLLYRGLSFHRKWCFRLKRYIDSSFVRKYQ
jgi:pyridine nucleotide-disulfide oxidoreductase family protein